MVTIFIATLLLGCSAPEKLSDNAADVHTEDEKRTDFGKHFIENANHVAYLNPSNELYVYNHETKDEFLVHESVDQFDIVKNYVLYLASDGITSELDIELQAIYRTHLDSNDTEKMVEPMEEDDAFTSPRAFHINNEGYIAIEEQVGFFYSNYWYNYYATDIDFTFDSPIINMEDEYDLVLNELQWQDSEIFVLIERPFYPEDAALQIELHSFSVKNGPQLLQENALPLTPEEYIELFDHTVYITVEESILSISAVDKNKVEKITYQIDLDTMEIIHKTS